MGADAVSADTPLRHASALQPTSNCRSVCLCLGLFSRTMERPPGSHPQKFQKCWEVMLPGSSPQTRAPGTRCTNALVLTVGGNVLRCVSDSTPPHDPALFASCDGRGNDAALSDCSLCLCHLPTGVLGPSQINGLCSDLFF